MYIFLFHIFIYYCTLFDTRIFIVPFTSGERYPVGDTWTRSHALFPTSGAVRPDTGRNENRAGVWPLIFHDWSDWTLKL